MAEQTVGEQEDARAFRQMRRAWERQELPPGPECPEAKAMRFAWDKAIQRGQELRGCCEDGGIDA